MILSGVGCNDGVWAVIVEQVVRQDRLFYEFCLDDRIPADYLLRRIDAVLELSWPRKVLAPY